MDDLLDETPYLMGFELRDTINPGSIISALPGMSCWASCWRTMQSCTLCRRMAA